MKKIVVLFAAMVLVAGSAMASSIVDSAHNLSSVGPATRNVSSDYGEICVFCHTPHNADTTVTLAPLWNRTVVALAGSVYTSGTLTATAAAVVIADIGQTDAPLCLSCHDGTSINDPLVNPSNLEGNAQPTLVGAMVGGNLGANFNNDHPIAFDYNAAQLQDAGLVLDPDIATAVKFPGGEMWCSSCHSVHDDANLPFLLVSNAGSGLCLTCHIK